MTELAHCDQGKCPRCNGTGTISRETEIGDIDYICGQCKGTGEVKG